MSDSKDDASGELEDEQLSNVTGGVGVGSPEQPPDPTDPKVPVPGAINSPGDLGSGLAAGRRKYKEFVIKKDPDPTMA